MNNSARIKALESEIFLIQMKDHMSSDDFDKVRQMEDEIKRLKEVQHE